MTRAIRPRRWITPTGALVDLGVRLDGWYLTVRGGDGETISDTPLAGRDTRQLADALAAVDALPYIGP
jgi:hypothetical protein